MNPDPERYRHEVASFAVARAEQGGILLLGSSSVRRFDPPGFPEGLAIVNRGFGGAHVSDLQYYMDELLRGVRPSLVVLYCGENDLWAGKSPARVILEMEAFAEELSRRAPGASILMFALRPSLCFPERIPEQEAFNAMLDELCRRHDAWVYEPATYDRFVIDGRWADVSLFDRDGIHMNEKGYAIWTELIRNHLPQPLPDRGYQPETAHASLTRPVPR